MRAADRELSRRRRRLGAFGLALALLVVAAAWLLRRPGEAEPVAAGAPSVAAASPPALALPDLPAEASRPARIEALGAAPSEPTAPPEHAAQPGDLVVVVVDPRCVPVPAARIELWEDADHDWDQGGEPARVLQADAGGRCAVPTDPTLQVLVARRDGVGCSGYVSLDVLRQIVTGTGEAVVRLRPRMRLSGRVVEPDDRAAPGVRVIFWPFGGGLNDGCPPRPVLSDAEGRFALDVDDDVHLGLQALDGDRRSNEVRFASEADTERDVLLRLPGDWTVGGIVFSARAEPLADVKVTLWRNVPEWALPPDERPDILPNSWYEETRTGADGRFVFAVGERMEYTLIAQVPGELPTPAALATIDAQHEHAFVELTVPRPSFLAGRVLDARDAGVPGLAVRADTAASWSQYQRLYAPQPQDSWGPGGGARTDAQGAFRIEGLHPDGLYRVGPGGKAPAGAGVEMLTGVRAGRDDLVLRYLPQLARPGVTFTLRARDGGALEAPRVQLYHLLPGGYLDSTAKQETLADGSVHVSGLQPGERYVAYATAAGYARRDVPAWVADEDQDIDVELLRPATLLIDVRAGGRPVPWAEVWVGPVGREAPLRHDVRRDADGEGCARFSSLDPVLVHVTVKALGHSTGQDELPLADGQEQRVEIDLER